VDLQAGGGGMSSSKPTTSSKKHKKPKGKARMTQESVVSDMPL
jgi:hypothetical protein